MLAKKLEVRLGIGPRLTVHALDQQICAVQFDEPVCRRPGDRMQPIDVLRHDHQNLARFLQRRDRVMNRVRPRIPKSIPTLQLVIPVFDPRRFRRKEILEVNRLSAFPDPLRPTKIRNPAAG
jgi:hypothetical protein